MLKKLALMLALVGVCGVTVTACAKKEESKPPVEDAKKVGEDAKKAADSKAGDGK